MNPVAAVFDVDGTLVHANAVEYYHFFVKNLYPPLKKWLLVSSIYLRAPYWWALDQINRSWFDRSFYLNFYGLSVEKAEILGVRCFEDFISKRLIPQTVERVRRHQKSGDHVILLSSSLDFILRPLSRYLNVEATLSPSLLHKNGRFRGILNGPPLIGKNKVQALEAYARAHDLDLSRSVAYADSKTDLPLLKAVGHAVVVNPKGKLKKIAQDMGWEILTGRPG